MAPRPGARERPWGSPGPAPARGGGSVRALEAAAASLVPPAASSMVLDERAFRILLFGSAALPPNLAALGRARQCSQPALL